MDTWAQRGSNLLPVELTRELLQLLLPVALGGSALSASEHERRLALGCSIQRLINGFADANQRREYASSVMTLATRLQLPRALVDTRHEVAHGALPSLAALERAGASALRWLVSMFWAPQMYTLQTTRPWLLWETQASVCPLPTLSLAAIQSADLAAADATSSSCSVAFHTCSACAGVADAVASAVSTPVSGSSPSKDRVFDAAVHGLLTGAAAAVPLQLESSGACLRAVGAHAAALAVHLLRCISIPAAPFRAINTTTAPPRSSASVTESKKVSAPVGSKRKLATVDVASGRASETATSLFSSLVLPAAGYACLQRACAVIFRATRALVIAAMRFASIPPEPAPIAAASRAASTNGYGAAAGASLLPVAILISALPGAVAAAFPAAGTASAADSLRACGLTAAMLACESLVDGEGLATTRTSNSLEALVRACTGLLGALGCNQSESLLRAFPAARAAEAEAEATARHAHPALALSSTQPRVSLENLGGPVSADSTSCCIATQRTLAALSAFDGLAAATSVDGAAASQSVEAQRRVCLAFSAAASATATTASLHRALTCAAPLVIAAVDCDAALPLLRLARSVATRPADVSADGLSSAAMFAVARNVCVTKLKGYSEAVKAPLPSHVSRVERVSLHKAAAQNAVVSTTCGAADAKSGTGSLLSLEELEFLLAGQVAEDLPSSAIEHANAPTAQDLTQALPHDRPVATIKVLRKIRPRWHMDAMRLPLLMV